MIVTPSRIVILVRLVQPLNAYSPMEVTLSGIVTLVRPVQSLNAYSPIEVTLLGIVILVRPVQPLNAKFPMVVTLLGILTQLTAIGNEYKLLICLYSCRYGYTLVVTEMGPVLLSLGRMVIRTLRLQWMGSCPMVILY